MVGVHPSKKDTLWKTLDPKWAGGGGGGGGGGCSRAGLGMNIMINVCKTYDH